MIMNVESFPEQMLIGKLARSKAWTVVRHKTDFANKRYLYEILKNANETLQKSISFADACIMMGWKSYEYTPDRQSVIPVVDEVRLQKEGALTEKLFQKAIKNPSTESQQTA